MVRAVRCVFLWLLICPAVFGRNSEDQLETQRKREIIQKLCSLGEMRPVRCKTEAENMKIQSPKFPKQKESRLSVLEMSFRIVSDLMKNASTEWESSELQQLHNLLEHQKQFYTPLVLVSSSAQAEVEPWSDFWRNLAHFLAQKSFSSCAWESARPVILQVMRTFYRSTTKPVRPVRSC